MVTIGTETYDQRVCLPCAGKGEKWDPTMAHVVGNGGTGMVACSSCSGNGYRTRPAGSEPGFLDGALLERCDQVPGLHIIGCDCGMDEGD
jgi:hypothetical protein